MKKSACIVIAMLSTVINFTFAQKSDRAAFDSAYIYFSLENYQSALPIFLKLYGADPENSNLAFHIGVCYKHMPSDKYKAIPFLKKASENVSQNYSDTYEEKKAPVITYFYLGTAYLINYDLGKSITATEKYKSYLNENSDAQNIINANRQISMCNVAREMIKNPIPIQVENLGSRINTRFPEYAPVVDTSGKLLFFTTRRNTNIGRSIEDNGYYFEDIYISKKDKNSRWGTAANIGKSINTEDHEASISLSADKKQLFIYKDDGGDGNIYVSNYENKEWTKPKKLHKPINTRSWETHACLSSDGNTLYFTSDRKGGYGGLDIYKSTKRSNGKWGEAENLDSIINTEFNEEGPFILSNNTLYFCSEGHNTMGGYDIFYSRLKNDGTWSEPVNIGYPINTTDDDMYYTPTDSVSAYFASVRVVDDFGTKGFGNLDIYSLTIHEVKIIGLAIDKQTNEIIPGAKITLMNDKSEEIAVAYADDKGAYAFAADYNKNYKLKGQKEYYTDGNNTASTYNIGDASEITADLLLETKTVSVSLKIQVTDAKTGAPLKDVSVPLTDTKSGRVENLTTNVNGEVFKSLDDKKISDSLSYNINFNKNGYEPRYMAYRCLIVKPGEILIKEKLEKSGTVKIIIKGVAYDKNTNKIIPGTEVTLMNEKKEIISKVFADEKGAYSFNAEYNRNYNLKGQKDTYSDGFNTASTINAGNAKEVTADLLLEKKVVPVSLRIEVTDAGTGEPIKDVTVPLKETKSGSIENLLTNINGEINKSLQDKKINDSLCYNISFSKEGYVPKDLAFRYLIIKPGEILIKEQLNKIVPSKIIIRGVAYDKNTNKIIPGTEVTLMNEKKEIISKVFADEKGAYSFNAEYNRNYNLKGQKDTYSDGFNTASTINAGNAKEVTADLWLEKATAVSLKIQITDAKTSEPLKDVSVVLTDEKSGTVINLTTDENGEIFKSLDNKKINDSLVYNLKLNKECFIEKIVDFRYRILKSGEILIKEMIGKIGVGADLAKIFKINPIYFDLDKYYIRPDAAIELDKIVKIMNEYPDMVIELGSHTDCRASYAYNNTLSDNRAKSSAEYIRKRITDPERIYGKGYGETKLVNKCECEGKRVVPCTEEEHQMNRRTEFIIVSVGDDNAGKTGEIKISGTACEMSSNVPVPGAEVTLMNEKMEVVGRALTDENGKYSFIAEYDKNYQLNGKKDSYEDGSIGVSTFHLCNARQKITDIKLKKYFSAVLKIQVTDAKTKQPLKDVNVLLKDIKSLKTENYNTNEFGEIVRNLDDKKINDSLCYEITLSKESYITKVIPYKNRVSGPGEILIKEAIGKIEVGADLGKVFQINPIYFDLDKYNIRPDAAVELDKIVKIMNEYQEMVIELGSHTDCRSSFDYNITLSNNRAKASAAYIQKRITNPMRIYGKGYGETKLVNKCECEGTRVVPCTEEEHQMNRRTEFIIISY